MHRRRIGSLLLAGVLVGCAAPALPPATQVAPSRAPQATTPVGVVPSSTPTPIDSCHLVLVRLGDFTTRMAEALAALRPLIVANRFNAATTLSASRRVSALSRFDAGLQDAVAACAGTASLQAGIDDLNGKVAAGVAVSLKASFDRRDQRRAAVTLWKLLPSVLVLAGSTQLIARSEDVVVATPVLAEGATDPLGKLPKIR